MALDIYVGSFTRYLAGDWENPGQRYCREQGIPYKVIGPKEEPEDAVKDPALIGEAVELWRRALEDGLRTDIPGGVSWDESTTAPYFTDRPAWGGYAGVMLLAAYTEYPHLPRPDQIVKEWQTDAAFVASVDAGSKGRFSHLILAELWLPCDFNFTFKTEDVVGNEVTIGSSIALLNQLKQLNQETYSGKDLDQARWRSEYATGNDLFHDEARFGLSIYLRLAELSVRHKLPMKLDY